ncbi:MAG: ORF6N domain-containing protein [Candidatus Edwardsbacteria bacterium]|nr:ORF6N domain-containing protein [Candidatus Edwardsbacteria bacterium]MBU1575879.1 ORF6N domain-containing protein [Candidatus Edwardsbacteria bacterium]MBU2464349.1 ORF6N domain-containing protein [Candidatus Edwardsbacteria bacterium]MBU2593093.1 ORF6N domain-containing protein [Candidatus Edwardsbacteria bacterium]
MTKKALIKIDDIQNKIHTIRGVQVMLDSDLATLYQVEVKVLNQAVKRNVGRFPKEFMFYLSTDEYNSLRSQIVTLENTKSLRSQNVTLNSRRGKHRKYQPYVFTEQGVAMLSAVLRSDVAVKISISIMNAFISMRRFIAANAGIMHRVGTLEVKQLEMDKKMDKVWDAIESKSIQPKQGVFYNGQVFDAYKFISDLFRSAKKSIIIIDPYIDETVLIHLTKRPKGVKVVILTKETPKQLSLDVKKFNQQYPTIEIKEFKESHDRFIIIDRADIYHIGASLKDLGKKWFAFSKMDMGIADMIEKLKNIT